MEDQLLGEDTLLWQLRESRRRFRRTPLSLPQYNQPFEDAPLVQMSTLTYETPQGTSHSTLLNILQFRV
uniref:Uncharacterized protein n=1 Tax=Ursus americanus TaxID=9643 RepID=A0A452SUT8_URSAM